MKTLFCMVLAAIAVGLGGCETESSDQIAISISPNNVTLKKGESQTFTASGWQDYTWSLTNDDIGVLSNNKGDSTVYTAVTGPSSTNATLSQILILSVNVSAGDSGSTTNLVSGDRVTAQALITQTP
jgi:hypothetical protein